MSRLSRRRFLKSSLAAAGAGVLINGTKATGNFFGANETIRVGVAGINGRGGSHIDAFGKMQDVKVAYLIDPDTRLFKSRGQRTEKADGEAPKMITDVRRVLDDKDVDAISVATPNHWHSLITIWACQAGKDVYVEKPCSHNIHEGRMAVETARRYKRIVQHGTQSRSSGGWEKVMAAIASGKLGKLLVARGLCYKPRGTIGFKETTTPPPEVDFNIWLGPAPQQPYHANLVHYNWHWFWDFGNGDIGNQGVHEMDKARWAIPGGTLPKSVISFGGRFGYEDQGQTPNTQVAIFDYGDTQLIFEVRGLKTGKYHNQQVGNVYHLEGG
ncbi:MAG TPA: Gfo/Idh/MocA family oxidoreductase, partial [Tepidisphaeraceae bacterium]|nr:Gfo/Idh/MocA family oxidoreductase [Tepidisphaeraceae bacterium]